MLLHSSLNSSPYYDFDLFWQYLDLNCRSLQVQRTSKGRLGLRVDSVTIDVYTRKPLLNRCISWVHTANISTLWSVHSKLRANKLEACLFATHFDLPNSLPLLICFDDFQSLYSPPHLMDITILNLFKVRGVFTVHY